MPPFRQQTTAQSRNNKEENSMKKQNDWLRNKDSKAIVYQLAGGTTVEVTLEVFLKSDSKLTAEDFKKLKSVSDKLFKDDDDGELEKERNELPLFEWSDALAAPTEDKKLLDHIAHKDYLERRKKLIPLKDKVLDILTPTQRRRYLLHYADGLTENRIAEVENATQQSINDSLQAAQKKINKFLAKNFRE
jgi:DNA-directed RNA polymerase specialized sigma24 family protein